MKIKSLLAIGSAVAVLAGCSSREMTIEPVPPANYEKVGNVSSEGRGHLVMGFIPAALNTRTQRAKDIALSRTPEATELINVTLQENWTWWYFGTTRKVTLTGDAIKEVK